MYLSLGAMTVVPNMWGKRVATLRRQRLFKGHYKWKISETLSSVLFNRAQFLAR